MTPRTSTSTSTAAAVARRAPRRLPPVLAALVVLASLVVPVHLTALPSLAAIPVVVNSTDDDADLTVGDGICDTGQVIPGGDAECTLRAALEEANASAVDEINFAVPAADPGNVGGIVTIAPAAALPTVTAAVTIDGSTQPEFSADPIVAIDGSAWATALLDVDAGSTTIRSLVLESAGAAAIDLDGGGSTVQGTWIGLLPDGTTAAGPASHGILVNAAASGSTIGGSGAGEGNVIAAAGGDGVHVLADGATVAGNLLGTTADGTGARGATGDGVRITGAAGTAVTGNTIANHAGSGVRIDGATGTEVSGNILTANTGDGVTVTGATADDAAVLSNSIVANTGLGIDLGGDLGGDGATPNDAGDLDTGPNGLLNAPVPTAASPAEVVVDLDVPAGDHRLEVFRNPTDGADASGSGEGEELVGAATVTHTGSGTETFSVTGLAGVVEGDVLTLTATEDLGAGSYGATSEFSGAITADDHVVVVNDSGDAADTSAGDGVCTTGATNADGDPACTLRAALQEAAAAPLAEVVRFAVPAGDTGNVGGVVTSPRPLPCPRCRPA